MGVAALLKVTGQLDAPRMFERSAKLSPGQLHDDRGLVSMDKRALYPGPLTTLTDTCAALGISQIEKLAPHIKAARSVHFGSDGPIAKCYLEFAPDAAPAAGVVFLALKMKADAARLNTYKLMPQAEAEQWVKLRLGEISAVGGVAMQTLSLAQKHDPDGQAVVLHVTEEGTDRESIDISVADAAVSLADVSGLLAPVFAHFDVDAADFMTTHGALQFGHLAIGSDQLGEGFATIYYGARPI
ncbi:hypothetical protein DFP92_10270 [Yoonia sediminilitoris]|uniref:Uncharacterized protein n=2 Tax=Yoonia sediminilitoris TaxID=1286148 RepID=A0A2T6KLH1_9RHOB|nr:hypothetical protein C8N45_10270 [Yoonia sediminilitoris]RCW97355.1 hypothetical protein DFP92_10270 [Yoonia sediminilitoris]